MNNIAIVGGGLVGSLLSVYLAKQGCNVTVYERRANMRNRAVDGGRSINLALSNRGWRALNAVGMSEKIRKIAIPMEGRMIHQEDGRVQFQPYGQKGEAIYSVSRGVLNNELDKATDDHPNVDYVYDCKCTNVDLDNNVLYLNKNGEDFTVNPDIIIGADGAFSAVRRSMQFKKRFNYQQQFLPHAYKELSIPAGENGGWQLQKNALHIWPRRSFMLIALPNLDGSFTCTLFLSYEGQDAFENLKDEASVKAFFETEFPDAIPLMPTLIEDFFENPTDALVTIRCAPWNYGDKVMLMGDASHAIVPFYGQGMNSGFEDCRIFNELVEANKQNGNIDWTTVFSSFNEVRIPDAEAIADLALKNFIEMRDSVADQSFLLRKKIEKHIQNKYPDVFTPAYALVTFRDDVRYSEALRRGKIQDELFGQLLQQKGVAEKFENDNLQKEIEALVDKYKALTEQM